MRLRTLMLLLALSPFAVILPAGAQSGDAIDRAVNDNPYRTPEAKARDVYRHPAETLRFFGIRPDMTVVEPLPGWYTEILAALLKDKGSYIAVNMPPRLSNDPERRAAIHGWRDSFIASKGDLFGPRAYARFLLTEDGFAAENSVDAILAFRSTHGWVYSGVAGDVMAEFFRVLKPGGVLGIVQHRENEDSPNRIEDRRGYLKESFVISLAEAAGFRLADKSEINANPKDSKDYKRGVWELPPVLAVSDESLKPKHLEIGESDRMTIKFIKPAN